MRSIQLDKPRSPNELRHHEEKQKVIMEQWKTMELRPIYSHIFNRKQIKKIKNKPKENQENQEGKHYNNNDFLQRILTEEILHIKPV